MQSCSSFTMSIDSYFQTVLIYFSTSPILQTMQSCRSCTMANNSYVYLTCIYLNTPQTLQTMQSCNLAAPATCPLNLASRLHLYISIHLPSCKPCNHAILQLLQYVHQIILLPYMYTVNHVFLAGWNFSEIVISAVFA